MANQVYGIFESTNIRRGVCFSFVSDVQLENGNLVHKGELVEDKLGNEVYRAIIPTAETISAGEPVFVVGNPAWSYDTSSIINQNEDAYYIPAGKVFRVYALNAKDKFGIANYGINDGETIAVGEYIVLDANDAKPIRATSLPASGFAARVVEVVQMGNEYWIGKVTVDQRTVKVRVEVVRN